MDNSRHEAQVEIRATPEQVWSALTDPEQTRAYYYGTEIRSDWQPGSRWTSESGDELYLDGELLEVDRPRRIVQTFHVTIEEPAASDPPSRVTWELTPIDNETTRLRMIHEDLRPATRDYVDGGWEHILAGLKALLETGEPMNSPAGEQMAAAR
ncbi:MAG TPA: SRPBCC family protein [Candidatus Limnocylindrales bacterium]|nr:SRPBCC family protein [Candidatus Limnocylindrales bacterium]